MLKSGQHGGNTRQIAEQYNKEEHLLLDFSANINPLGMPKKMKQAIVDNLSLAEQYPDIDYKALYQSISLHCQQSEHHLMIGNGATELIYDWVHIIQPRKALLMEPSFGEYRRALQQTGCEIITHILKEKNQFRLDASFINALSSDLDCIVLCTPNNPTGQLIEASLLNAIIEKCHALHISIMIDESFMEFVPNNPSIETQLINNPNLTILRSLTKYFAIPGLRLGYLMSANQALIQTLRINQRPWSINAFAAIAGEHISDHHYQQVTSKWLTEQQQVLFQSLSEIPYMKTWKPHANYLFFKLEKKELDLQHIMMLNHNILIRSCANYIGLNKQFYRIAIKSADNNRCLITALQQEITHG